MNIIIQLRHAFFRVDRNSVMLIVWNCAMYVRDPDTLSLVLYLHSARIAPLMKIVTYRAGVWLCQSEACDFGGTVKYRYLLYYLITL